MDRARGMGAVAIVIPFFEERENLARLLEEIHEALHPMEATSFELLFVDDGSRDGSEEIVTEARLKDPRIDLIRHPRKLGKSAALLSGFEATDSPILVTLDADLQNPPAEIRRLLAVLAEESCDAVLGVRVDRHDSWNVRAASRVANTVRRWVLHDEARDAGSGLMAFRRHLAEDLLPFRGLHRFLPVIWAARGARIKQIAVEHRPRVHGESKFTIRGRAWRGLVDLIGMRWWIARAIDRSERSEEGNE